MSKQIDILYLCDRKACKKCSEFCEHTINKEHAIHKDDLDGRMFEYVDVGLSSALYELKE